MNTTMKNMSLFGENLQSVDIPSFLNLIQMLSAGCGEKITAVDIMPGGLTNKNFKVTLESGKDIALRVAGFGTAKYINRPAEKHNASLIASIDIAPEIYYYDTKTGSQICEYINADTMHPEDFINNETVLTEAAKIIRQYHDSGFQFKSTFSPIDKIMEYLDIIKEHNFTEKYEGMDQAIAKLDDIRAAYAKNPPKLVPCHNDTLAENFMYDGSVMRVIDWEYGGMNDPFYDIACVIVENPLDAEKEKVLLKAYVGGEPDELVLAKTLINKFLVTTHWSLWSLVQICFGKEYDFYWEYGRYRSDFFNGFMADPNFDHYIKLLGEK